MIKDGQVREMRRLLALGNPLAASARMTFMNEKTARRYRDDDRLPSQRKKPRDYRTRVDPFAAVWRRNRDCKPKPFSSGCRKPTQAASPTPLAGLSSDA